MLALQCLRLLAQLPSIRSLRIDCRWAVLSALRAEALRLQKSHPSFSLRPSLQLQIIRGNKRLGRNISDLMLDLSVPFEHRTSP